MRMTRTRQRWVNRLTIVVALAAVAVSVVAGATLGAATAHKQHVRVLPETFGPPVRLAAGKYKTRPGFSPASMFTVGSGWYGAGSSRDWAVGKGFNQAEERFGLAGIWTSRLRISYTRAVARFRALMTLEAGPSTPIRVGGYPGVAFRAEISGDHALLPGIAPGLDVVNSPGGQQILLNVRGATLLFRIEVFALAAGNAAVRAFLRTVRFPR
jgi:hypothetical protein